MKLGYTIHEVQKGKDTIIAPGRVHPFDNQEHDDLTRLGAIREPSRDEIALYEALLPAVEEEEPKKSPEREQLEAKATELGVKFQANTGDAALLKRIEEAEAKKAATTGTNPGVDTL